RHAADRDAVERRRDVGGRHTRDLDAAVLVAHLDRRRRRRLDLEVRLDPDVLAPGELVAIRSYPYRVLPAREPPLDPLGERARLLLGRQEHHLAQPHLDDAACTGRDLHRAEAVFDLELRRRGAHGTLAARLEAPGRAVEAAAHHAAPFGPDAQVAAAD